MKRAEIHDEVIWTYTPEEVDYLTMLADPILWAQQFERLDKLPDDDG